MEKILNFCEISGSSVKKYKGKRKYVATGDILDNEIIKFEEVDYEHKPSRANQNVEIGNVLFAKMKDTIKVISITENNVDYIYSTGFYIIKPKNSVLTEFLYWLFNSPYFNKNKNKYCKGATQKALNNEGLSKIEINKLPTIEEQKNIVKQLDKVQEIINIRKEQIKALDELIKSQFIEMFGSVYDNKDNYPIKELDYYTSMITYGLTIRPKFIEKGIDLISAREINSGIIDYNKSPKISEEDYNKLSNKSKPKKNEILFSKTGTIGLCAIIEDDRKFAITQNAARIVPKKNINSKWLLHYLRTDDIQNYCKRQVKGNAVKDFQIQDMKKIPILDCPIDRQNQFAYIVEQINKKKNELQKSLEEIKKLQESLMNKYFE